MTENEDIEKILYMGVGRSGIDNENSKIAKALNELMQHRAIGTVEEFKSLKEKHISNFAEETKDMDSVEILNYYRNLYYAEPNTTEQGIVAIAINDILPTYVNVKEIRAKTIDEFAEVITAKLPKVEKDERVSKMAFVADMIFLVDGIAEKMKAGAENEQIQRRR